MGLNQSAVKSTPCKLVYPGLRAQLVWNFEKEKSTPFLKAGVGVNYGNHQCELYERVSSKVGSTKTWRSFSIRALNSIANLGIGFHFRSKKKVRYFNIGAGLQWWWLEAKSGTEEYFSESYYYNSGLKRLELRYARNHRDFNNEWLFFRDAYSNLFLEYGFQSKFNKKFKANYKLGADAGNLYLLFNLTKRRNG